MYRVDNIFYQLAFILSITSLFGVLVLKLRFPLVVAYLLAGVALSFISFFDNTHSVVLHVLPEMGVAFVLFLIGMELDLREIKALGFPIIISAVGQIVISTLLGAVIAMMLGFTSVESVYLGLGLAFSSTVVVVKLLLEKHDVASLYGKLSIGILLVEDLIAIIVLMLISVSSSLGSFTLQSFYPVVFVLIKAFSLFFLTFVLSKYVLRSLFDGVAQSVELLFLTAITWCFAFTALALLAGFTIEIGAFLAGVALASSPYHFQIQGKVKPLRDFFLTMFFIYLGSQIQINYLIQGLPAIIIFTLCAIILKPLVYMLLIGLFGFRKYTLFQTALNLSQISDFYFRF
jgi:Kef-type K+ transport system membrane component KefB